MVQTTQNKIEQDPLTPSYLTKVIAHPLPSPLWLTLGNFDGCHLGHQAVFKNACRSSQGQAIGVTFYPHPVSFFSNQPLLLIDSLSSRVRKMLTFGLKQVWVAHFNHALALRTWEDFLKELISIPGSQVKGVCVGQDFTFGKDREGSVEGMRRWLASKQIECVVQSDIKVSDRRISSGWVREVVKKGDFKFTTQALKCEYRVGGIVKEGVGMGKQLGFSTANVLPPSQQVLPPKGVYIAYTVVGTKEYPSVVNIGTRPTIDCQNHALTIESHIMGYSQVLHGRYIEVKPLKRLRDEIKFHSKEALKSQIRRDVERATEFFK